jgi:uncharacterized protein DUF6178
MPASERDPPNNVVALSPYRARLGRGRRLRRADALLEAPDLEAAVRALPGDELYYVLHEVGLREGADLLACTTADQLAVVLDFGLWDRDRITPAAVSEWVEAISEAPVERIGRWLTGLDTELVGLIIRRGARIYDVSQEGPPEEPEGVFFPTPDNLFVLDVIAGDGAPEEDIGDQRRAFIRMIDGLYRWDKGAARRLLVGARAELDSELEEAAYRWRQARMADLGFADYYDALEVYRELDPATVRVDAAAAPARPLRTTLDARTDARIDETGALRVPTALAERLADGSASPFANAARLLTSGDEVNELRFALVALTNRVLAADRVAPGDDAAVAATLDRLVATLDLAMERIAQGNDELGVKALRAIPLSRVFRLGVSLVGKVKRLAWALRRQGPFGARGLALAEPDDVAVLEALTRLRPVFPRVLDEPPAAGERPFRTLGDLARATAAVEQMAAAHATVRGLGVTPEDVAPGGSALANTGLDEAGLDLAMLARTVLVKRLLGPAAVRAPTSEPFAPLTPDEPRAFEAALEKNEGAPPKLPAALEARAIALLLAAAPATLATAAAAVAARWVRSLAPLEPVIVAASPEKKSRGGKRPRRSAPTV